MIEVYYRSRDILGRVRSAKGLVPHSKTTLRHAVGDCSRQVCRLENPKSQNCKCYQTDSKEQDGCSMAQAVSWQPLAAGSGFQFQSSPYGICDRQIDSGTDLLLVFQFVGALVKLRKASISFVMSVCPSARKNSAPTGRNFITFDIQKFFEYLSV